MIALGELTMGDCGRRITLSQDADVPRSVTSISGPLRRVEQHQEWVADSALCDFETTYVPGRRTTTIQVGPFTAELRAEHVCVLD